MTAQIFEQVKLESISEKAATVSVYKSVNN